MDEGPDGHTADWTDWIEPLLIHKDGTKQKLTELRWKTATSGFGGVVINKNCSGGEMHVDGVTEGKQGRLLGIGTHANSIIAYDLPQGVERFEAKVGLDKGGTDQSVNNKIVASIYTAEPPAKALASNRSGGGASDKPHGFAAAKELMSNFKTPKGLSASLFAAEPMVQNPTNIDIDPRGRVWVMECVNYRKWGNPAIRPEGDRIVILECTKGDGVADNETTFWQSTDLQNGLGICVLPNPNGKGTRVIASFAGKVVLLTDADGDDKAEKVETLLKVDGAFDHDHHIHAVSFGSDGKFYFNMGNAGTALQYADGSPVIDLMGNKVLNNDGHYRQGMIFRCDIDLEHAKVSNVETLAHNFRNNYEVTVDSFGGMWQSDNDDDGNKGVRINNIVDYGSYGYTDEMTGAGWRTPRTNIEKEIPLMHWHQNDPGTIPNLLQTGQGSPTGICVNEGATLGKPFENQVIHCDAGPRVVRAYPVKKSGAGFTADMLDILTTDDTWYRPSDCCIAPDGSLFVADWYDPGVGGHAMGDNDAKKVRGRLYRVAPEKLAYKITAPDFSSVEGCVNALQSPNLSTRYVAFSKLNVMGAKAEDALKTMWSSTNPRVRARVLHLLVRIPGNLQTYLEKGLADNNPDIRATAVRELRLAAANHKLPDEIDKDFAAYLLPLIKKETDKQVLREYALALHVARDTATAMPSSDSKANAPEVKSADSFAAAWLALAKKHDGKDRWYLEALGIGGAGRDDRAMKAWLASVGNEWNTPAGRDIVWRVRSPLALEYATKLLTNKNADESTLPRYLRAFDFLPDGEAKNDALLRAAEGNIARVTLEADILQRLSRTALKDDARVNKVLGTALAAAKGTPGYLELVQAFSRADLLREVLENAVRNPKEPGSREAIKFLLTQQQEGMKLLRAALTTPDAEALVGLLAGLTDKQALTLLYSVIVGEKQQPTLRQAAIKALALTSGGALELVGLAESGKLPAELKPVAQSALAMVQYPGISERASKVFPPAQAAGGKALPPIAELVKMKGDAEKGKVLFAKAESSCTLCHRVGSIGVDFAPGLSEIGSKLGKDAIFDSILNPNAGISMGFETTELKLKNGSSALGIVRSETDGNVVLVLPGGVTNTFKKDQIAGRTKLPVSMMPSGLQALFSQEDLVNLVEYLYSLKTPAGKIATKK